MKFAVPSPYRLRLQRLYHAARAAWREWMGEAAYERHCARCVRERQTPLDRGRFFAQRLDEHYRSGARCC